MEIRRLVRSFLVYGIGGVLQKFMGLLLLPLFTRVLSPEDYGVLALLAFVAVALSGVFNLGTGNSMGLLYFREEGAFRRATVVWSNALLMLANGAILAGGLYFVAPSISTWIFETPEYADLLRISFIGLAISSVTDPFLAFLRMEEKARLYVMLSLTSAALTLGLNAWFVLGLGWGIMGATVAGLVANMLTCVMVGLVVARRLEFNVDFSLFQPLVRIGFPSIFGLFAFLLIDYADRQMLQRMLGLHALGIYTVGYNFGMAMLIFVGAFSTAWPAFFMSFINREDEAKLLFGKVLRYYTVSFGLLALMFFATAKPMVEWLTGTEFHMGYMVIGMVATAYMLKGVYLIFLPGLYFRNKLHLQAGVEWSAAIVNICFNLWWIPLFGIVGAAAATVVGYLVLPLLAWRLASRHLDVVYDWPRMAGIGLVFLVCAILLWRLSSLMDGLAMLVSGIALVGLTLPVIVLFGIERSERRQIFDNIRLLFQPEGRRHLRG